MPEIVTPPTPAPVPVATPTPAPVAPATPPVAAPAAPSKDLTDIDAAFTAAGIEPAPTPAKSPEPAPKGKSGEPTAPAAPAPASPKPATPPVVPAPEAVRTPKELRAELDRVRGEAKDAMTAKTALESKIKEFESKGKDTEALMARLESRDKEFERLQGELRALKQEASPEFKKQYDEPFNQSAEWAKDYVNRLKLADGTQADYNRDFVPLYRMAKDSGLGAAKAKAKEMFGEDEGDEVFSSVRDLVRLDKVRASAFEQEKAGWAEKAKQEEGLRVQRQETWKRNQDLIEKDLENSVPDFKDPVDDAELQAARKQFIGIWESNPKTVEQAHKKAAYVKHAFLSFGPHREIIKRQAKQITELKDEIAKLKPKQPNADSHRPSGNEPEPTEQDWEAQAKADLANIT